MFPVMPYYNFHDEAINLMRFSGNNTAYLRSKSGSRGKRKKNMLHVRRRTRAKHKKG